MKHLDCRGLTCPGPVIRVKKTLKQTAAGESFSVELDSEASRENVIRFAKSRGAGIQGQEGTDGTVRLTITAPDDPKEGGGIGSRGKESPVIFITGETIGRGDDKLGRILMEGFINTLPDQERIPDRILFMNSGVKFTVQGSPVLQTLASLVDRGCEILVCGTCLDFFSMKEELAVGIVSNMFEIQKAMLEASSVIKL